MPAVEQAAVPRIWFTVTTPVPPMPIMWSGEAVARAPCSAGSGSSASSGGQAPLASSAAGPTRLDGEERRAVAEQARVVLVARGLVDLRSSGRTRSRPAARTGSSTSCRSRRSPRRPRSLMKTRVCGIGQLAALAQPPLLRRALLVVDQHGDARRWPPAPTAPRGAGRGARPPRCPRWRRPCTSRGSSVVTMIRLTPSASSRRRERGDGQGPRRVLAAGHRHRRVVEDLVGDVDAGGDRVVDARGCPSGRTCRRRCSGRGAASR